LGSTKPIFINFLNLFEEINELDLIMI